MKGQNRILSEILLFSVGIMITGYVVINFDTVQNVTREISIQDQMTTIANTVSAGILKASQQSNATLRIEIPEKISGFIYLVTVTGDNGGEISISIPANGKSFKRKIFNIDHDNTNSRIVDVEIVSSSKYIDIVKDNKITLRRPALSADIDIP